MMFFTLFALLAGTAIIIIGGSHYFLVFVLLLLMIKMVVLSSFAVLHNVFTPREQSYPAFTTRTPKTPSSTVTVALKFKQGLHVSYLILVYLSLFVFFSQVLTPQTEIPSTTECH